VHDCHELYLESGNFKAYERGLLAPIERRHMRRAARVVAVNESIAQEYNERYGVRPLVVRNCAKQPEVILVRDIRDLAGLAPHTPVVLYQGGLSIGRGLDVCVAAMTAVAPDVHLVMLGHGPMEVELRQAARDQGVGHRVHVIPAVAPDQLLAYTASATLGLIPYQPVSKNNYYSLPNKAFEYASVGLPMVVSDLPELRRVAVGGGCGVVFDPYDPVSLARAIAAVIDAERYPHFRAATLRFGAENTWANERTTLVGAIEDAMAGSWVPRSGRSRSVRQNPVTP
ncbi:MAG TPA: glycosyltransferase, partial [Coriobacteriia bacterium]|nr:glycosyltransferase [Coriobacteriia bacterium]